MRTLSVHRATCGGYVGEGHVHPALLDAARGAVAEARESGAIDDGYAVRAGGHLVVVLLGSVDESRATAASAFASALEAGQRLGQAPTATGPGAEVSLDVTGGPVVCLAASTASAGALNAVLWRAFADPFTTPRLLSDGSLMAGFRFEGRDPATAASLSFDLPDDLHGFLSACAGGRLVVTRVSSRRSGAQGAVASDGRDAIAAVRCDEGFPSVAEVLEAVAAAAPPSGMAPVSTTDDAGSRGGGPGRLIGLGFVVAGTRLVGPRDVFADRAFDEPRRRAFDLASNRAAHGPFSPAAMPAEPSGTNGSNGHSATAGARTS